VKSRRTREHSPEIFNKPVKHQRERQPDPIQALTARQGEYLKALAHSDTVIVLGPAGTGKTYIAGTHGADLLRARKVSKIILTRPNVSAGQRLGFFPGSLEEKMAPWAVPLTETISKRMGRGAFDIALKNGDIEIAPFETMRGRTFDDAFIILDEAQNTTPREMKMFLTRMGQRSQVVVNGDVGQTDLKETSGLATIIRIAQTHLRDVPIIEFDLDDIVRGDRCAEWARAFHAERIF
jgi:phosphate starvation-inducible PhoH-like protein